jgi:hypothetical protein
LESVLDNNQALLHVFALADFELGFEVGIEGLSTSSGRTQVGSTMGAPHRRVPSSPIKLLTHHTNIFMMAKVVPW